MREDPVRFGPTGDLVGIVATAVQGQGSSVGCLLFNAGVIHRVGPHRINVKLARALAAAGIPSLRMDLSGLGDSAASRVSIGVQAQAVRDLQDGISALKTLAGVDAVIVVGICSGAVSAYDLAQVDERVHGLLMFDGYTFPTLLTHLRRRWRRLMSWRYYPERALGSFRRDNAEPQPDPASTPPELKPSRQQFADAIERLVARGVAVNIVYSGSFLEQHNYSRQLDHAFRGANFLRHIRNSYLPSIDHTITPLDAQRTFLKFVVDWASDAIKSYRSSSGTTA